VLKPFSALLVFAAAVGATPILAQQPGAASPASASPSAASDLPRAVFIATMDAEFRRRDADGNGVVDRAELERFETVAAYTAAQAQNRDLFLRLDADRNGTISPGEFAALVSVPGAADVTAQMARFDPNRDQRVTLIEYRAATLAGFDRLDTDLDGVVTAAEMRAGNIQPAGR
jgi:Ca2+-binding EF-hand superfamily protein